MKFYPDDPVAKDEDQRPVPQPAPIEAKGAYDFVENTFILPGKKEKYNQKHSVNINTLGEVPDSSWFTNRIGIRPMSEQELIQGRAN